MPNISSHMIVALEVGKRININSKEFVKGNLLPDIIDIKDSHHKVESGPYLVPDIDYFLQHLDFSKDINIGYLVHLLLDKHYLEDYLLQLYPNRNIFLDQEVYKDYDYLNYRFVKKYKLDVDYLEEILKDFDCKIKEETLKYNIECLKQQTEGKTKYLDFDSFSDFITNISDTICKELINYADKYSQLSIRIRQ